MTQAGPTADPRSSVLVLTHNRIDELERSLLELGRLPEKPHLIVVDNGSQDGTAEYVAQCFPHAELVRCLHNLGAAGRNAGVARVRTPYVAFCDDDTWWAPGALRCAADLLDAHPRVAAIAARVLVGPLDRVDPTCDRMAASPLDRGNLPGPALIGFMAGATVMRVAAYREVGGFEPRLFLGAEEALLAMDLAARGWSIMYAADVVTHHHPSPARNRRARRIMLALNRIWIAWLRLPGALAWRETRRLLREAAAAQLSGPVLRQVLTGAPWLLRERRVLPPVVLEMQRRVSPQYAPPASRRAALRWLRWLR